VNIVILSDLPDLNAKIETQNWKNYRSLSYFRHFRS